MSDNFHELLKKLPDLLGGHILLSVAALATGLAVSLPLGIAASRRPRFAELTLGFAGVVQTVPSLALLALMVPLLGGLIGFWPAFVALVLYSILPILANTIIGIREVDPNLIEAARGLGMSDRQMLLRVQLPLAAPVVIAGIRTATVLVVGTATLVTPVGGTSLGSYIFSGLQLRNHLSVVFGCVLAAALALVLDQLVRLLEVAARRRSPRLAWLGAAGLLVVLGGGMFAPLSKLQGTAGVVVSSAPFTEQYILSRVVQGRLEQHGFRVDQREGMAERIQFQALCENRVDCYVDYSGNVWAVEMRREEDADRQTVLREITAWLSEQFGVVCLGSLGFEDAYAFALPRSRKEKLGLRTVADLARLAPNWQVASDDQLFARPEWKKMCKTYGLAFKAELPMDPTLMYGAVRDGRVDVICAYTSDGRIKAYDLALLDDPRQAFPPYDAVLLVSPQAAARQGFLDALRPLIGAIDVDLMRQANLMVDVDGRSADQAGQWLRGQIEKKKAILPEK